VSARRSGTGTLLTAILLALALLAASAVFRSALTTNLAVECHAALSGELAEALASSAVAEMEAQVRQALARPDSEITRLVTRPVVGEQRQPVDLTRHTALRETASLVQRDPFLGAGLSQVSGTCVVSVQKALDRLPYERVGVVTLRAEASGRAAGRAVRRTVEESRAFKVVLAGPPRPFDQFGLFIGEAASVTALESINPARAQLIAALGALRTRLEEGVAAQGPGPAPEAPPRPPGAPGPARERLLDLLDELPDAATAAERAPEVPAARPGSMLYGLMADGARIDLPKLHLAQRLADAIALAQARLPALPPAAASDLAERAAPAGHAIADALWSVWAFQEAFKLLTPDAADAWPRMRQFLAKLDHAYLARRAHYRIAEEPGSSAGDVTARLAELVRRGGPLSGVVHVDSRSQRLVLTGRIPGRVMIVVGPGGALLDGVNAGAGPDDRLTVACFGGAVVVRGLCRAHVLTGPATAIDIEPGAVLEGGLTIRELVAGSRLAGSVERSERYGSGEAGPAGEEDDAGHTFTAILSPHVLYRRVLRS
jgi:hypothetical protein